MGGSTLTARVRPSQSHLVAPWKLVLADLSFAGKGGFLVFGSSTPTTVRSEPMDATSLGSRCRSASCSSRNSASDLRTRRPNSPDVDHPNFDQVECCFNWVGPRSFERRLLGPEATHGCRDVLRTWLADHPNELNAITEQRPEGPLAISHRTGHRGVDDTGRRGTPGG